MFTPNLHKLQSKAALSPPSHLIQLISCLFISVLNQPVSYKKSVFEICVNCSANCILKLFRICLQVLGLQLVQFVMALLQPLYTSLFSFCNSSLFTCVNIFGNPPSALYLFLFLIIAASVVGMMSNSFAI